MQNLNFHPKQGDNVTVEVSFTIKSTEQQKKKFKTPMRVPRDSLCELVEKNYPVISTFAMKKFTNFSDIEPGDTYCPFPKANEVLF